MQELDHRAGPAVREEQRHAMRAARLLVDEMQLDAAQACRELTKTVYPRLVSAPVESVAPVRDQLAQVVAARAGRPHGKRRLVRKARARQPLAQVGERAVRHVKGESADA